MSLPESEGLEEYFAIGASITDRVMTSVRKDLDHFISEKGIIQGSELQSNWFPAVKTHIFLSHSHADHRQALIFAGILYDLYSIETFVDSILWGYSYDLLRQIDNKYCKNVDSNTYSYERRNYSTSHVNLMLSVALNKMIDNCECLFFMNTPNSLTADPSINKTSSPWIYSEIAITQIVRKKIPERISKLSSRLYNLSRLDESLKFEYDIELAHLTDFNERTFSSWLDMAADTPERALDNLYSLHPIRM